MAATGTPGIPSARPQRAERSPSRWMLKKYRKHKDVFYLKYVFRAVKVTPWAGHGMGRWCEMSSQAGWWGECEFRRCSHPSTSFTCLTSYPTGTTKAIRRNLSQLPHIEIMYGACSSLLAHCKLTCPPVQTPYSPCRLPFHRVCCLPSSLSLFNKHLLSSRHQPLFSP